MTNEEKAANLESWARFFKRNTKRAAHFQSLAEEMRGHVPPDTRQQCSMHACTQPAITSRDDSGNVVCGAHYADGVL